MSSSPIPEAIQDRDSKGGQLGLSLQDLDAGFGAELDHLEVAAAATAAGRPTAAAQVLDLATLEPEQTLRLDDFEHPVTAYLNSLAPSSRRPQLSALDWIARRATQVYTAETMPWHRLRRPHVLKIRGLLEEHYQPATANRMLSAPPRRAQGVLAGPVDKRRGLPGGDQHSGSTRGVRTARAAILSSPISVTDAMLH